MHVCAVLIVRDDANFKIARTVSRVAHTPTFCNAAHFLATLIRNFPPVSKARCKEHASHMALLAAQDKNTLCNVIKYGGIDFGERCF